MADPMEALERIAEHESHPVGSPTRWAVDLATVRQALLRGAEAVEVLRRWGEADRAAHPSQYPSLEDLYRRDDAEQELRTLADRLAKGGG